MDEFEITAPMRAPPPPPTHTHTRIHVAENKITFTVDYLKKNLFAVQYKECPHNKGRSC